MFSLSRPICLALLAVVPLFFILRKSGFLRQTEFPLTLGDWNGLPFRWSSPVMRVAAFVSRLAVVVGLACVVVALSGPTLFRQEEIFSGSGATIVFALDVSPSMAARDIGNASRLDQARRSIRDFADRRPGDSLGLVALGSEAALLVPPTPDHKVFLSRLDSLAIGELGDGTALGMGLAVAAAHLVNRDGGNACVILLTDGENNTGEINPRTAAEILPENGISLIVAGIGTRGEVPIEYTDPLTGKLYSGFLESEYDEGALREIAARGKGAYIPAGNREMLDAVFSETDKTVPTKGAAWTRSLEEPLERPFILASLALFAFAWFVRRLVMGALV